MHSPFASFTHDKRRAFFYTYDGNEKQAEVMIDPFKISPGQSAYRALSGILIQNFGFRGNTGN